MSMLPTTTTCTSPTLTPTVMGTMNTLTSGTVQAVYQRATKTTQPGPYPNRWNRAITRLRPRSTPSSRLKARSLTPSVGPPLMLVGTSRSMTNMGTGLIVTSLARPRPVPILQPSEPRYAPATTSSDTMALATLPSSTNMMLTRRVSNGSGRKQQSSHLIRG